MSEFSIRTDDLADNPTPRLAIAFCLDVSASTDGPPNIELNAGLAQFYGAVQEDDTAKHSAEPAIVLFAERATVEQPFAPVLKAPAPRVEIPVECGATMLGAGVTLALDELERRKDEYKQNGVEYYQPWLVIITDGHPTDHPYPKLVRRVRELVERKKLSVFAIGVGEHADLNTLAELSPGRGPIRLKGLNFQGFFEFLSASVSQVSGSGPGDEVALDTSTMQQWAVA